MGRPARLLPEHERVADAALKALWARWVLKRANELNNAVLHGLYVNVRFAWYDRCLLYTSDAADERSSVDLGGRRIIKKKKKQEHTDTRTCTNEQTYN